MAVSRVLLIVALAVVSGCCSASSASAAGDADRPVVLAVSGCPVYYRNWTIDCRAGDVLTLLIANFLWIDSVVVLNKGSGASYDCGSVQAINTTAVSCVLPAVQLGDTGKILAVYVHDQISNADSDAVLALEYNSTAQAETDTERGSGSSVASQPATSRSRLLIGADPVRPVVLNASGCARQYRNWTIDCAGGERLTLTLTNFSYIDSVSFYSRHTGVSVPCGSVEDVDLTHVSCQAPNIAPSDIGVLLQAVVHDSVSDLSSLPTFAIAYNKTRNASSAAATGSTRSRRL